MRKIYNRLGYACHFWSIAQVQGAGQLVSDRDGGAAAGESEGGKTWVNGQHAGERGGVKEGEGMKERNGGKGSMSIVFYARDRLFLVYLCPTIWLNIKHCPKAILLLWPQSFLCSGFQMCMCELLCSGQSLQKTKLEK